MTDYTKVYQQLTSVDIEKQKRIWDDRGKGYYGEYLLFCRLYKFVPGTAKILMNLEVPVDESHTTEIDLILFHKTGLYVFEVKHYKGTIYGKNTEPYWTQYFRTAPNSKFRNPIEQNGYHIRALQRLLPTVPIHSFVVFTHEDCDLRVTNTSSSIDVCRMNDVEDILLSRFGNQPVFYSTDDLDMQFRALVSFSKMQETVLLNQASAPFHSWVEPTILGLESKKAELEAEKSRYASLEQSLQKCKIAVLFIGLLAVLLCVVFSLLSVASFREECQQQLDAFKQNFLHVDQIGNEYIDDLQSYVEVSNVSLTPLTDDACSFTVRLAVSNDVYGIQLTETSKYIVMTTNGKVFEYDVFGEHLKYYSISNKIGTGIRSYADLAKIQFYGIPDIEDISYIKLTDITLFKLDIGNTIIKDSLELELYST